MRVLNAEVVAQRESPGWYKLGTFFSVDMEAKVLERLRDSVDQRLEARGLEADVEIVTRDVGAESWMACDAMAGTMVDAEVEGGTFSLLRIRVRNLPKPEGDQDPLAPWIDRFTAALNDYIAANIATELAEYGGESVFLFGDTAGRWRARTEGSDAPATPRHPRRGPRR